MAVTAVLYHNIAEQETAFEAGLGVTTNPSTFEKHLKYYQKNYDIIDIDTLISGKLPKRPLVITFDDCYRSVLEAARQFLAPSGLPSVFFVNPNLVGGGVSLDNRIAWAVNRHGAAAVGAVLGVNASDDVQLGALIADVLGPCTVKERLALRNKLEVNFPISRAEMEIRSPMLELVDVMDLGRLGVEIGNHTASHVHCGAIDSAEYYDELVASKNDLEAMSGRRVRSFSVAYGHERDLPDKVLTVLRNSGHEAIFLVHARSNIIQKYSDVWYRVSFRNEIVGKLPLRLSVYPLIRTIRDQFKS